MFRNSSITTSARGSGNGGNLDIKANTIVDLNGSSINANAYMGRGGDITIATQGLFLSPDSVITASSQLGVNGTVSIRTIGFDMKNILIPFSGNFVTKERVVVSSCLARRNGARGRFVVTGSGGLPLNPDSDIQDWEPLTASQLSTGHVAPRVSLPSRLQNSSRSWKLGDPIVEARGIVRTPDGRILLSSTPQNVQLESTELLACHPAADKPKS